MVPSSVLKVMVFVSSAWLIPEKRHRAARTIIV